MDFGNDAKEFESIASQAKGKFVWMMKKGLRITKLCYFNGTAIQRNYKYSYRISCHFLNESYIGNIYKSINIDGSKDNFLVDTSGMVISSKNTDSVKTNSKYTNENLISHLNKVINEENTDKSNEIKKGHIYLKDEGKEYLYTFAQVEGSNWFVVATIPTAFIQSGSVEIRNSYILYGYAAFRTFLYHIHIYSHKYIKPIKKA
jgi:hypothetical protein